MQTTIDYTDKSLKFEESDFDWAIKNYREYYRNGKSHLYSWKRRQKPEWI